MTQIASNNFSVARNVPKAVSPSFVMLVPATVMQMQCLAMAGIYEEAYRRAQAIVQERQAALRSQGQIRFATARVCAR